METQPLTGNDQVGVLLREYRRSMRLSQDQVSVKLGVQQQTYSRYERGARTVPLSHALMFAQLLRPRKRVKFLAGLLDAFPMGESVAEPVKSE